MKLFDTNLIKINLTVTDKEQLLEKMAGDLLSSGAIKNKEDFLFLLMERESSDSTGIGRGIAIPHVRYKDVMMPKAVVYLLKDAVDYDSLDGNPVDIVIMLALPNFDIEQHKQILVFLSRSLREESDRKVLKQSRNANEVMEFFTRRQ